ncbi:MAG: formylglycine-generating enzyme family protein [Bradymonadaceae bacterium]
MAICPECKTTQTREAPYCESCGYRMRRADTMKEGVPAVDQAMLSEYLQNGGRAGDDTKQTIKDFPAAGRQTSKEIPSASLSQAKKTRATNGQSRAKADPSTLVEGLRAVDLGSLDDITEGLEEDTGPEEKFVVERPIERSGLYMDPTPPGKSRLILWIALWFGATAIGILVVYFVMDQRIQSDKLNPASVLEPSEKILIEAGPFRQGLNEEVRSFILQSCYRLHDDPDEGCEQDKLLKGEFPEKTVDLPAYSIDSKEVTVDLYQRCVLAGTCTAINYRECAVWTPQGLQISLRVPKVLREGERAAVCVTRGEAEAFCGWSGGALPTGDQWEKAARGTRGNLFPWGDVWGSDKGNWGEADITRTLAVGKLDGFAWTAPPGSFPDGKSPYGAYDMAGNVAEWVRGEDALVGHARGGSWISNPFDLRTTGRLELKTDVRRTDVGFRCAYEGG